VFVSSLPDCQLSESDVDDLNKEDCTNCGTSSCRWGQVIDADYDVIRKGGVRKSSRAEAWAMKAFDEQRAFRGYPTTLSIMDLSEQDNVVPLVDLLVQYFLELKMQNGRLYQPTT
jgi:hypothetical protein